MIQQHILVLDDLWSKRFERYADLQHQWDQQTVALFVAPIRVDAAEAGQASPRN